MNRKPMLAVDCAGEVTFPALASPKLDGVRAITTTDGILSRSLKPIPNVHVQEFLSGLPFGLDGELTIGPAHAPDVYRKTVSVVMSDDKPIDGLTYWVFDRQEAGSFQERFNRLHEVMKHLANNKAVRLLPQVVVHTTEELERLEREWVAEGYEGVILRKPDSPYKHGRSTLREGYLLKLKRFADGEAELIGVTELMHNENDATVNELGRAARSHKKEGMVPAGVMGTLVVRDVTTGVEFEIGTGFTAAERAELWAKVNRPSAVWPLVKYKHFPVGAKDKPRHPVFIGWRDRRDV